MVVQTCVGPWPAFQFLEPERNRKDSLNGAPVRRKAPPTHRITQAWNTRTQISMSGVGFQPRTSVFKRTKAAHASDRAAIVMDLLIYRLNYLQLSLEAAVHTRMLQFPLKQKVCCAGCIIIELFCRARREPEENHHNMQKDAYFQTKFRRAQSSCMFVWSLVSTFF
jgi:hypothetical protein